MLPTLLSQLKVFLVSFAALTASVTPTPTASQNMHMVSRNATNVANTTGTSTNWAGYTTQNGQYTQVSGTWTIPTVTGISHTSADATWVGIGGISGSDLIQSGTVNTVNPTGQVTTSAFYELLPSGSTTISTVTVSPGDSVTASLSQTATNQWQISFKDNTTGQSFTTTVSYTSSLSSAEWIEEAPSDGNSTLPLDNFGTISFTNSTSNEGPIAQSNGQILTMVNNHEHALATSSALGSDGESFTITRTTATSSSPIPAFDRSPEGFRRHGFGIHGFTPGSHRNWHSRLPIPTLSESPTPIPTVTLTPSDSPTPTPTTMISSGGQTQLQSPWFRGFPLRRKPF